MAAVRMQAQWRREVCMVKERFCEECFLLKSRLTMIHMLDSVMSEDTET